MKRLNTFLVSSALSIVFILLTILLLTQMDQGGTLIVDLLEHPGQWLLFMILYNGFALILSHYPVYIHEFRSKAFRTRQENRDRSAIYQLHPPRIGGIGFITYQEQESPPGNSFFSNLRKILGLGWHVGILYILLHTWFQYSLDPGVQWIGMFAIVLWIVSSIFYIILKPIVRGGDSASDYGDRAARWVTYVLVLFLFALGISLFVIARHGWSDFGMIASIVTSSVGLFFYGLFSMVRTKMADWIWSPVTWLSDHLYFLYYIALLGLICWSVAIYSTIDPVSVSPVLTLMSFYYLFYGVAIVLLKHYYLHTQDEVGISGRTRILEGLGGLWFVLLVVGIGLIAGMDNSLHSLPILEEGEYKEEDAYLEEMDMGIGRDVYLISAYGGGLKAHAWNLLLMDAWGRNPTTRGILSQTVSCSGVSGGALGQAFYLALLHHEADERKKIIDRVVRGNFLTVDIAYVFGYDLVREGIPRWIASEFKEDRAMRSMKIYEEAFELTGITETSFRSYWNDLYHSCRENGVHVPALLVNSTATHHQRAIGSSVQWNDFEHIFPDADDLTEGVGYNGEGKSISYAHMASCANRFPIFSPAARIEGKGHYLDGGYFENSGLLTSLNLYRHLEERDDFCPKKVILLNIVNDRSSYIRHMVPWTGYHKKVKSDGEIMSILGTITNIDAWPNYMRTYLSEHVEGQSRVQMKNVYLPYRFSVEDVEAVMKGALSDADREVVEGIVEANDAKIEALIAQYAKEVQGRDSYEEYEFIEPPLARILTDPAVDYMNAVIYDMSKRGWLDVVEPGRTMPTR